MIVTSDDLVRAIHVHVSFDPLQFLIDVVSVKIIWNPRLFNVLYMNCNHIIYIHMYYSHCVFGEVYPPNRFDCGNVI